ncbi:MAG: HDIG domain-containing metalloprotein [Candidatus Woesearchaeota archaeon]
MKTMSCNKEKGLNNTISKEIELLKKYHNYKNIILHSITVAKLSAKIAEEIKRNNPKLKLNVEEVKKGALLHDIDKFLTLKKNYKKALLTCKRFRIKKDKIEHGVLGAEILKREGLEEYSDYCLKHPFCKILHYKKEPLSLKIVYFADKIAGDGAMVSIERKIKVWMKRYGIKGSELIKLRKSLKEFRQIENELVKKTGMNKKEFYKVLNSTLKK